MKRYILLIITFLCFYTLRVFAWGQMGHRIVAEVAYQYMSKNAVRQVDGILGKHGMVYCANWADEIKSDTIYPESHDDHYQDLDGGMTDSAVVSCLKNYPKEGGELFRKYDSLVTLLQEQPRDVDALKFLVHLAGDRYCPMHVAHLEDHGGNAISFKWHKQSTNLHSVWDTHLIASQGYSYSEYAAFLVNKWDDRRKEIEAMSEEQLLLQTYQLTQTIYEHAKAHDGNTYHYIYRFLQDAENQLFTAGVRLAKILNRLYK